MKILEKRGDIGTREQKKQRGSEALARYLRNAHESHAGAMRTEEIFRRHEFHPLFDALDELSRDSSEETQEAFEECKERLLDAYRDRLRKSVDVGFCEGGRRNCKEVEEMRALIIKAWREDRGDSESHRKAVEIGRGMVERADPKDLFRLLSILDGDPMTNLGTPELGQLTESCKARLIECFRKEVRHS